MKILTYSVILLVFCFKTLAQSPQNKATYIDFGYKHPVIQVATGYYKADDKGYDPSSLIIHKFDEEGRVTHDYLRIFGKYGSETVHQYIYKNGKLDSMNARYTNKTESGSTEFNSFFQQQVNRIHPN